MGVAMEDHTDLLRTTLRDLPRNKFEVMWTYQQYEFNRIFAEKKTTIDGGTSVKRNVVLDHTGQAKFRQMFDLDTVSVANVHKEIDVPWTNLSTQYSWDVLELMTQRNSAKGYISLIKTRVNDALWAWADLIEERGWQTPTSATDNLYPYGIPYYLNRLNTTTTTDGFLGQTITYSDASTGTVCAGIDAAVEAKWRNWAALYTVVDNSLLKKFRTAFAVTRFFPPRFINNPGQDAETDRIVYCGLDTFTSLGDMLDKRDDNNTPVDMLGGVKIRINQQGVPFINGHPIVYIPILDDASFGEIYAVDWAKIRAVTQADYWMKEGEPMTSPTQHTVLVVYTDGRCCILCSNRRTAGFVLHTAT